MGNNQSMKQCILCNENVYRSDLCQCVNCNIHTHKNCYVKWSEMNVKGEYTQCPKCEIIGSMGIEQKTK